MTLSQHCQILQYSSCFPQQSLLQTYNSVFTRLRFKKERCMFSNSLFFLLNSQKKTKMIYLRQRGHKVHPEETSISDCSFLRYNIGSQLNISNMMFQKLCYLTVSISLLSRREEKKGQQSYCTMCF